MTDDTQQAFTGGHLGAEGTSQLSLDEKASLLAGVDDWHLRGIERLGIVPAFVADCGHGVTLCGERSSPATCFPTGIGMASTWNPALLEEAGRVIGRECRALGVSILLGPKINLHRLPLNGRSFETFSEDPLLAGRLGAAIIRGIQAEGVGACLKAMAANNQQHDQQKVSSEVSERALRELYLRGFEIAIAEGAPCAVMTSYNRLNGAYAAENRWLIQQVLKDEWKFPGLVVSDWRSIFTEAVYRSGLDLEMPGPGKFLNTESVLRAVADGRLSEAELDDKAGRILRVLQQYGRDENDAAKFAHELDSPENRAVALRVAEESIVLLQNTGNLLPLDRQNLRRIAVVGPNAAVARVGAGGSASVTPFYSVSPLEGIRELAGPGAEVVFAEGCSLVGSMTPIRDGLEHRAPDGSWQPGLLAEFFDSPTFGPEPDAAWVVPEIDFSWGWASPGPGVSRFGYKARFSGRFLPKVSGRYGFGLFGQEGLIRMQVGGGVIVPPAQTPEALNFEQQYESRYLKAEFDLQAGSPVEIIVEYQKCAARGAVRFEYEAPGMPSPVDAAVELARTSDVAIVCVGLSNLYEGGGRDRSSIDLPAEQVALIERVAAVNPRTVVIANNGGPISMPWTARAAAVLEAWYPGQEGGRALARILFGEVNPSGCLPDTIAHRIEDHAAAANYPGDGERVHYAEGVFVGYRHFDTARVEPQFPFGFGLSYTDFAFSEVELSARTMDPEGTVNARVRVSNTGERAGAVVVQLYVRDNLSSVPRPDKELRNFTKLTLKPAETRDVELAVRWRDLAFWNESDGCWWVEAGEFEVLIGPHSRNLRGAVLRVEAANPVR